MPTLLTHAAVPLAIGLGLGPQVVSRRLMFAGVIAAVLPDLDVLAFKVGIAYTDAFGHRGASHSVVFAALLGLLALTFAYRLQSSRRTVFLFIALCAVSHGILDMFTDGGQGSALWWPWSEERLFAPWQVIEASPLSLRRFLGARGIEVLQSELTWVWLPAIAVGAMAVLLRKSFRPLAGPDRAEK